MIIAKSTRAGKRFMATFANGKVVHFGAAGGRTYIARHSKNNENWTNPYSPGALSRWLLWGDSTSMDTNHRMFMKNFKVS